MSRTVHAAPPGGRSPSGGRRRAFLFRPGDGANGIRTLGPSRKRKCRKGRTTPSRQVDSSGGGPRVRIRLLRQPVRLTREFRDLQEGFGSGGTAGRHLADRAVEIDVRNQPGVAVAAHHVIELTGSPLALMIWLRTMTPAAATAVARRQLSIIGNAIILIAVADLASDFIGVAGLTGLGVGAFLLALKLDARGADRNPA